MIASIADCTIAFNRSSPASTASRTCLKFVRRGHALGNVAKYHRQQILAAVLCVRNRCLDRKLGAVGTQCPQRGLHTHAP